MSSSTPLPVLQAGVLRLLGPLFVLHRRSSGTHLSLSFVPSDVIDVAPRVFDDLAALTALDLDSSPGIARSLMKSASLLSSLSGLRELGLLNTQLSGLPPDLPRHCPSLAVVRLSSLRLIYRVQNQG